jgi:hypothetical protein
MIQRLTEKFDLKDIGPSFTDYYIKGKITIHGSQKNIGYLPRLKKKE